MTIKTKTWTEMLEYRKDRSAKIAEEKRQKELDAEKSN